MGYAAGRAVGYGRTAVFGAGVAVGVLIGSPRARAGARSGRVDGLGSPSQRRKGPGDDEIAEQVRRRLAGSEATWNLAQPKVTVGNGRVRLDGEAPDVAGRRAIAEAASEVDGVREVDNRIVVLDSTSGGRRDHVRFEAVLGVGVGLRRRQRRRGRRRSAAAASDPA